MVYIHVIRPALVIAFVAERRFALLTRPRYRVTGAGDVSRGCLVAPRVTEMAGQDGREGGRPARETRGPTQNPVVRTEINPDKAAVGRTPRFCTRTHIVLHMVYTTQKPSVKL